MCTALLECGYVGGAYYVVKNSKTPIAVMKIWYTLFALIMITDWISLWLLCSNYILITIDRCILGTIEQMWNTELFSGAILLWSKSSLWVCECLLINTFHTSVCFYCLLNILEGWANQRSGSIWWYRNQQQQRCISKHHEFPIWTYRRKYFFTH